MGGGGWTVFVNIKDWQGQSKKEIELTGSREKVVREYPRIKLPKTVF